MTDEADGPDQTGESSEWSRLGVNRTGWIAIAFVFVVLFCVFAGVGRGSPDSSPGSSDSGYSSGTDDMSGSGDSTETSGEGSGNCVMVASIDAQIDEINQRITALQGGSVEGVPTYDEATTHSNSSEIMNLRSTQMKLQRARASAAADC